MPPSARRPRIFCIGLNKTATSSLHEALTQLGYRSLHWGGPESSRAVVDSLAAGGLMLDRLDPTYDAFSDMWAVTKKFDIADEQYPGSRFILTVRDITAWLDSRRRHVEKNQQRTAVGDYRGSFVTVDLDAWRAEWHWHVTRVRQHFAGRPADLLEMDITVGDGWSKLCAFLNKPAPDHAFPWDNCYRPMTNGRRWLSRLRQPGT